MATINCPVPVSVNADGTAKLELITLEGVVITGSEETFAIELSLSDPVFSAFSVADGSADASANPIVSLTNPDAFGDALGSAAAAAMKGAESLPAWLLAFAKTSIEGALNANGMSDTAEAEEIHALEHAGFEVDAQTGSKAMAAVLAANADKRNVLLTQFPPTRFDASDAAIVVLPYQVGDKFVVQFVITQAIDLSSTQIDITGAEGAAASGQLALSTTQYNISAKTVSVEITAKA